MTAAGAVILPLIALALISVRRGVWSLIKRGEP